jgi:hypothetical protein
MNATIHVLSASFVASLLASGAQAECKYPRFDFFPEKNGGVVVDSVTTGGAPCAHDFAEGPGYKFDEVVIDRMPEHGSLAQIGPTRFVYTPAPGYKGKDFYLFRICATKASKSGCSTIAFVANVSA